MGVNLTEKEIYNKIYSFAKMLGRRYSIDQDDLVNDAYLQVLESGDELTIKNLSKKLRSVSLSRLNDFSGSFDKQISETQFRFCKKCNEDLPIGAWSFSTRSKTGKRTFQVYCKVHMAEIMKERSRAAGTKERAPKIYINPDLYSTKQERQSLYHKKWVEENRTHLNHYLRKRYKEKKQKSFSKDQKKEIFIQKINPLAFKNIDEFSHSMIAAYENIHDMHKVPSTL